MNINKFLARTVYFVDEDHLALRKRITCADGFGLSIQASASHYCSPKSNFGPYDAVEVGYPSEQPPDEWAEYYDGSISDFDNGDATGIFGYVPVEMVEALIEAHGGAK